MALSSSPTLTTMACPTSSIERQIIYFQPGAITDTNIPGYASIHANGGYFPSTASLQVLMVLAHASSSMSQRSSIQALQRAQYNGLIPIDLNNDGFVDLFVGLYISEPYGDSRALTWGTTSNDGTGAFQVIDGFLQLMGVTTTPSNGTAMGPRRLRADARTRERTEGVVFEGVGGCGANLCEAVTGLKPATGSWPTEPWEPGPTSRTQARLARPASTSSTTCVATPTPPPLCGKGSMRVPRITSRSRQGLLHFGGLRRADESDGVERRPCRSP
ncbi:MAG: hypothetical protein U1F56_16105 [Rubrivivax sp.]